MPIHDDLGIRIKNNYETISKTRLTRRTPVIIRIDGKAFHTFTTGFKSPFDHVLMSSMQETIGRNNMILLDYIKNKNACERCLYYHEENGTCQSKKMSSNNPYVTWSDRLFCEPYGVQEKIYRKAVAAAEESFGDRLYREPK